MAKNKIGLQFEGFKEMAADFDKKGGDLKKITEKALQNSHDYVVPGIHKAMQKHKRKNGGDTEKSIVDNAKVEWEGNTASIEIGFDLNNGGLPSVFLMYGTPKHAKNHLGIDKDKALYDSIYGRKTKKAVNELQKKTFDRALAKLGG